VKIRYMLNNSCAFKIVKSKRRISMLSRQAGKSVPDFDIMKQWSGQESSFVAGLACSSVWFVISYFEEDIAEISVTKNKIK